MSENISSQDHQNEPSQRGPVAWMIKNPVAPNLLMMLLLFGGLIMIFKTKQEVFPEVVLDQVIITVAYPGAAPEEVEQGVILAIEEEVRGIDGVEEVRATADENRATVVAELYNSADNQQALNDIKSAVDRITSFPEDAERPVVQLATSRQEVMSLMIYGAEDPLVLRDLAESIRDDLLQLEGITTVSLDGISAPEISIEVPQEKLRSHGLTLQQIAARVRAASVDLPAGGINTSRGEVLLRTTERRDWGEEFENIAIIADPQGTRVLLSDIARVRDSLREADQEAFFNEQRAIRIQIFRVGDQKPLQISRSVQDYVSQKKQQLPAAIHIQVWNDSSEIYGDRVNLLLKNGALGLCLVLLILGTFLQIKHAFWVTLGIAISFCGAFLVMPALGISINMISLFAFILVLGIVVDDAIVLGEAIFNQRANNLSPVQAAIAGVKEVAGPVTFSVLTTITAFAPLLFVPGVMGKFFSNIPGIVIPILLFSLVESILILPAHLSHHARKKSTKERPDNFFTKALQKQKRFSEGFEKWIKEKYAPILRKLLQYRHITLPVNIALLLMAIGVVAGGHLNFVFMPRIEGETITATVELPVGSPLEDTKEVMDRLTLTANQVLEETGKTEAVRGIFSSAGTGPESRGPTGGQSNSGSHLGQVTVWLVPAGERELTASAFSRQWRQQTGEIPGLERLAFSFNLGPSSGKPVSIELRHSDRGVLKTAALDLAEKMSEYSGTFDIDEGFPQGKEQIDFELKPGAKALGISEMDLANALRSAFFGAEALRQQRGREELRVYVRLPYHERQSESAVENLIIQTPGGGEIPIGQAANIYRGHSRTQIQREGGNRVANVSADVDESVTTGGKITQSLQEEVLPQILDKYPGLSYELSGEQQERKEAMGALMFGMLLALLVMYALLAIAFGSYLQPFLVLAAIPFGVIGAVLGHILMGYSLSLVSMLGIVALAGVVVNDSLVMIAATNSYREEGMDVLDATVAGGIRRFRPVLLTSLTTFFGLAPMIFETSIQARFLIPMTISLGFGVLFVTVIALITVPAAYMGLDDLIRIGHRLKSKLF